MTYTPSGYTDKIHSALCKAAFSASTSVTIDTRVTAAIVNEIYQLRKENTEFQARIDELQFKLDSLCTCIDNPQDERYSVNDPACPIHGHREVLE